MGAKHRIASFTIETLQPRGLRLRLLLRISFLVHARKYTAGFGIIRPRITLVVARSGAGGGTLGERLRPQEGVSDRHDVREPGQQLQQVRLGVPAEECGEEVAYDGTLAKYG